MHKGRIIGFDADKIAKKMIDVAVEEQTNRLVDYAIKEIKVLGDKINSYAGAHHMDRTGNLLNSLCWVVTYGTNRKISGFYRSPKTNTYLNNWAEERGFGKSGGTESFLHEFFTSDTGEEVNGVQRAMDFIENFNGVHGKWKVAFAVLAPYWGYWESGFTMRSGGGQSGIPRSTRFYQFQVLTHIYDDVKMALKPAETHLTVYVPKYSYSKGKSKMSKKYRNRRGVPKF